MKYLDTELLKRTLDSVFEGRRILSSERIEEMSTPQAPFYHRSGKSLWGLSSHYDGGSGSQMGKQFEIDVFHTLTEKE